MKKSSLSLAVSLAALLCAFTVTTTQAQTAESTLKFERGFPVAGTAESSYDASDLRRTIETKTNCARAMRHRNSPVSVKPEHRLLSVSLIGRSLHLILDERLKNSALRSTTT